MSLLEGPKRNECVLDILVESQAELVARHDNPLVAPSDARNGMAAVNQRVVAGDASCLQGAKCSEAAWVSLRRPQKTSQLACLETSAREWWTLVVVIFDGSGARLVTTEAAQIAGNGAVKPLFAYEAAPAAG